MHTDGIKIVARSPRSAFWLTMCLIVFGQSTISFGQGWAGYSRDAQHSSIGGNPSQIPQKIRWSTPVDLFPQYSGGGDLFIHYGSPVITRINTVLVPVKTGTAGGFRVDAIRGSTGAPIWSLTTDYILPLHNWTPSMGITLTPKDRAVVIPAAGGTVMVRTFPDSAAGTWTRVAFYGNAAYAANPATFNNAISITTPITSDKLGNLYFGFASNTGASLPGIPGNGVITSGLARISATGQGSWVSAAALSGDNSTTKVVFNCAPAISNDGTSVYVAVNNVPLTSPGSFGTGYLCCASSATLAPSTRVAFRDPRNGALAAVSDDGTSSPTIGPDDDVYFGVLENGFPANHARGWMLHYSANLGTTKLPSAFGWDDTASLVPTNILPKSIYNGSSSYLLLTKYNNYSDSGIGGNGQNKLALVDPNTSMTDPITGTTVMNTVITILGPTPNSGQAGVREWCINSAAIDSVNVCAVVNCEDGKVYRWNFATNTLSPGLTLAPATGEAYTPTLIGPDGAVYAINNARLNCCVAQ